MNQPEAPSYRNPNSQDRADYREAVAGNSVTVPPPLPFPRIATIQQILEEAQKRISYLDRLLEPVLSHTPANETQDKYQPLSPNCKMDDHLVDLEFLAESTLRALIDLERRVVFKKH